MLGNSDVLGAARRRVPLKPDSSVGKVPDLAGPIALVKRYRTIYWASSGSTMCEQERYSKPASQAQKSRQCRSWRQSSLKVEYLQAAWPPFVLPGFVATHSVSLLTSAGRLSMLHVLTDMRSRRAPQEVVCFTIPSPERDGLQQDAALDHHRADGGGERC